MKHVFILLLLALLGACKSRKAVPDVVVPDPAPYLVALQTFPCRGFCPVYTLQVRQSGLLEYNGAKFVEKTGETTVMLTPEELAQLRTEVTKADLWRYPDEVKSQIMDAPYAALTVWNGTKVKRVNGSIDRPKPLLDLEKMLKNIAEAHGLKVIRGVNPNLPATPKSEVILKLRPEVNAGNWIARFGDIKLRLVRRLTDNTWLVAYDPAQIAEQQVIELLKTTDGALEVQANQAVEDRN